MVQTAYSISVIICAYTEVRWHDLVAAVRSVQEQSVQSDEIIVVVDHNPGLLDRVRTEIPGVIAIENRGTKGLSGARNSGATVAQGAVIAFLDDDAIAEPNWIECLVACYTDPHVVGVGGKIEPLWLETHPSWFPDEFNWVVGCTYRGMPAVTTPARNVIGANMSMRRNILMAVGGFRESFGCNHNNTGKSAAPTEFKWLQHRAGDEETEFCIRVAQQWPNAVWLYTPSAIVRHRVPVQRAHWAYFLWRCYDEGLGKAILVRLHGKRIGLASERAYTLKILPQGVVRGLTDALFRHDPTGFARAGAIITGLGVTTVGYLVGSIFLRISRSEKLVFTEAALHHSAEVPRSLTAGTKP